jgi:integrase/recombinase XerD
LIFIPIFTLNINREMGKNNRFGKAEILSLNDQQKIMRQLKNAAHKLFFQIALNTAERWGAIRQLLVEDVYGDPARSIPKREITFRAPTRKANPDGNRTTRQVPINDSLAAALKQYKPPFGGYLFPSPDYDDRPISYQCADKFLRVAVAKAKLSHRGISTHSTRRTAITRLSEAGVGIMEIKQITGHKSVEVLIRYIEDNPARVRAALAVLSG